MTMNNEYWAERFLLLNEMLLQKGEAYQKQLEEVYAMVFLSIEKEINDFYTRFANENHITFAQAKQMMTSKEREAFQMTLQEYIQYGSMEGVDEKWLKKLENASTVHRITMLQAIQYQLQHHAERLTAKKAEGLTMALKEIYKEGYYRTAYTMQINNPFAKIDENKIEKVLSRPWSPDGKNFSQRIWGSDRSNLIHQLNTRFTQGIIRGEAREKIIKDMKKALNSSAQATKRLVLTESAFVASASRKDCFEQLGVEKYQFLATLDLKTSVICQDMDGKVFERKDYQIGVTAPPMHPHCRSTTVPYFDDTLTQTEQRAARGEDGKTHYVPADMTYKQWYEKYVGADDADGFIDKMKEIFPKGFINNRLKEFDTAVEGLQSETVKRLLKEARNNVTFVKRGEYGSRFNNKRNKVFLGEDATSETIAHELFHKIDYTYGISESGILTKAIQQDYKRLQDLAAGYGKSIEDMLYSKYHSIFVKYGRVKEPYRGISDILHGMSNGELSLGYIHKRRGYWEQPFKLEKETFAQYGRMLYMENEEVWKVAADIFPDITNQINAILRGLE